MSKETVRYGLLTAKEARGNAGFPDSHQRPVWTEEQRAACEEERLVHDTDCAARNIASGPFSFSGSIRWTLREDDRTHAATLAILPLPYRPVRELLEAGLITTSGVVEEAWRAECVRLRL